MKSACLGRIRSLRTTSRCARILSELRRCPFVRPSGGDAVGRRIVVKYPYAVACGSPPECAKVIGIKMRTRAPSVRPTARDDDLRPPKHRALVGWDAERATLSVTGQLPTSHMPFVNFGVERALPIATCQRFPTTHLLLLVMQRPESGARRGMSYEPSLRPAAAKLMTDGTPYGRRHGHRVRGVLHTRSAEKKRSPRRPVTRTSHRSDQL
jgi:hypothetical protein